MGLRVIAPGKGAQDASAAAEHLVQQNPSPRGRGSSLLPIYQRTGLLLLRNDNYFVQVCRPAFPSSLLGYRDTSSYLAHLQIGVMEIL